MTVLRVLIAEDDPISATMLDYLVREEGHVVCGIVAEGGAVAEAVETFSPGVVLMDVHLADNMSGISATRDLLQSVNVPVIVVSGTNSREELREIAECGALGFIKKPISPDELRVNLRIAVRHDEMNRNLRASELLHRSLFDNAAVGIYICHADGYFLTSNQAFAAMLGYSGPAELLRLIVSLDEQVYVEQGRHAELLALLAQGENVRDFESQVYGRDGDMLWVAEHLVPHFDKAGVLAFYEGVVINITARKKAEAEKSLALSMVQNTVDAITDRIVVTDLQGNIIMSNQSFEARLAPAVGPERVLRPRTFGEDLYVRFFESLSSHPKGPHELRGLLCIENTEEILDVTISRYCAADGEVLGAVFVMRACLEESH